MRRLLPVLLLALIAALACSSKPAAAPAQDVRDARLSGAYTRDAGQNWTLVHLQGTPAQIGFQNGYLLAPRVEDFEKVVELEETHNAKRDWSFFRDAAKNVMWPKIEPEYQQELQGIADGVDAHGGHLDVWDVVAMNANEEWSYYVEQWDKTHKAQAAALDHGQAPNFPDEGDHCSAFVATGAWTKDGKVVMSHNNWSPYMEGTRWDIIYDIVPANGQHFVMDGLPGVIHSADDFGVNASGIMITETTISNFHGYDFNGIPEFVRARKAMQYATSIDDFAKIMEDGNNGGYANDWLVADRKTNEIASLELGLKVVTLDRSKSGYFVSSNFPINPKLIKEETDFNVNDKASSENARHTRWLQLMAQYKGKIDVAQAQKFEADHYDVILKKINPDSRTLCGHGDTHPPYHDSGAVEGKAIDSAMAANMSFMAVSGHPCGEAWDAAAYLKAHPQYDWQKPELQNMGGYQWVKVGAPASDAATAPASGK